MVWAYMGRERFTEPFCYETLHKLSQRPFNQLFARRSGLNTLLERAETHPGLPLCGLVFHMSRCGSTLAAQWLTRLPNSVVLSEPEPVDALLQWGAPDGEEALLRGLISAMGQPRRDCDRRLFVKADCSHIFQIERYLTAFPGTPWVFMYRNPIEVLVSHKRSPGLFQIPPSLAAEAASAPAEVWSAPLANAAWTLSLILRYAAQAIQESEQGLLFNYAELPQALGTIACHFGELPDALSADAMEALHSRHSKKRSVFRSDSEEKQGEADGHIRDLYQRWLEEPYQRLEQLRQERTPYAAGRIAYPPGS